MKNYLKKLTEKGLTTNKSFLSRSLSSLSRFLQIKVSQEITIQHLFIKTKLSPMKNN